MSKLTFLLKRIRAGFAQAARRYVTLTAVIVVAAILCIAQCGCMASRPSQHDDPRSATLAYWTTQPTNVQVISNDYSALWEAADEARRRFGFEAAMSDYRGGLMTTLPKVSPQWFEVWHHELRTPQTVAESSLATMRRRVRFEFRRVPGGSFAVEPKVLVERLSLAERRITSAINYRGTLGPGRQQQFGPADESRERPGRYWYSIGRDEALERALADRISRRVE